MLDFSDEEDLSRIESGTVTGDSDLLGSTALFSCAEAKQELILLSKLGAADAAKAAAEDIMAMLALTNSSFQANANFDDKAMDRSIREKDSQRSSDSGLKEAKSTSPRLLPSSALPVLPFSQWGQSVGAIKRHRSSPEDLGRLSYMLEQVVELGKPIEQVAVEMRHTTYLQSLALARKSSISRGATGGEA